MENIKGKLIGGYFCIAFLFALYGKLWGAYAYKGFAFNLGRSLIWPAIIFPGVGKALGGLLIVAFIGYLVMQQK